jgi:phospholipase/carboxylesterase
LRVIQLGEELRTGAKVVVLFHGYGARGDDLETLAMHFNERVPASYVLPEAPFALGGGGRAWFRRDRSNFDEGLARARSVIEHVRDEVDQARLVIGGFSQGAMITANLLAASDERTLGALIFSPANLLPHEPTPEVVRPPVFLSHGTRDLILPFSEGVGLRTRLGDLGYEVEWVEFMGRHQIPPLVVARATSFLSRSLAED